MKLLLCALLALLWVVADAAQPKISQATVKFPSGSLSGNDITVAEYEAVFDQNINYLEVTDCVDTGCVVNTSACACNYASKDPAVCGTSPTPGCTCDPSFCDTSVVDPWEELQVGVPVRAQIPEPFDGLQYRFYLPIASSCKAIHVRLAQHTADTDLYVTNDLTNLYGYSPYGGPYLLADTIANLGFQGDDPFGGGGYPWFSFRSKGDGLVLCPGEHWNADPTIDNYQPGTYYIQVQTYAYYGDFTITVDLLDIAPKWTEQTAIAKGWPLPVPCSVTQQEYPDHTCLGEDELLESRDWVADQPSRVVRYVKQMEGPCPHLYSFVGMDSPLAYYRLYARTNGQDANFTFENPWTTVPTGLLVDKDGLIVMDDFGRGYVNFAVCPTNSNRSTVFFMVRRARDDYNWYRQFFTVNPERFRATPINDLGPLLEQSLVMIDAINFQTPDAQPVPTVTDSKGLITGCTFDSVGQCANQYLTVTATTVESTPMYPPPLLARKTIIAGQIYPEPAFLATENISASLGNVFRATLPISLEYDTGYRASKFNAVPREVAETMRMRFANGRLVNSAFEPIEVESWANATVTFSTCNNTKYDNILQLITATEGLLENADTRDNLNNYNIQIEYLAWRPAYLGCNSLAQRLLNNYTNTYLINERNCVSNQSGEDAVLDPCCTPYEDWSVCCEPEVTLATTFTYLPADSSDSLVSSCGKGSECVYTYLEDYTRAQASVCRPPLQERFWKDRYAFWVQCSDESFGQFLKGRPCTTDADCKTIGNFSSPSSYCDYDVDINVPWGVDPDIPKTGSCVSPYNDLLHSFLDCFVDRGGVLAILVLENLNVAGSTTDELVRNLMVAPDMQRSDCLASWNTAFPPTDPGSSDRWIGQSHWIWDESGASQLCDSLRSPKMLHGDPGYLSFFEAPYSCSRLGFQNDIGTIQSPIPKLATEDDCEAASVCNYGATSEWYGMNATALASECAAIGTNCAVCRPDGTHCRVVPPSVVAANGGTCPTEVCLNVDGSITAVNVDGSITGAPCGQTCTVPCRDSNYLPVTCATEEACLAAGRCSDEGVFQHWETGDDGACIQQPNNYHRDACLSDSSAEHFKTLDHDIGCVWRSDDAITCAQRSREPRWVERSARSEAECNAYGCGCVKPAVGTSELSQLLTAVSSTPSTPDHCALCGQTCSPYFTWTKGAWVTGSPHPASTVAAAVVHPFSWTNSTFDLLELSQQLEKVILAQYGQETKSSAQCRYNKVAPSISAVSLACSEDPRIADIAKINDESPIGVGVPCGGADLTLSAPPNTLFFAATSVQPIGYCPKVEIFNVPADSFGGAAPSRALSTYFTKKQRGARGRTLEIVNAKGALIGQVLGNGIRILANETSINATRVRMCLNAGDQVATLDKKFDKYPVFDIAERQGQGSRLVPLRVNVTLDAELGSCATIPNFYATPGLDVAFVPIIRLAGEFEEVEPPSLTKGEKAILFLAAAAYFLTSAYAIYHMVLIILAATLIPFYLLPPFWMASMLALANLIRGVYFVVIGAEAIKNSNVADIILFELPTFMWFTATTLVVLLWISIGSARKQKEIGPTFRILFLVGNGVMYLLFVLFVVLFSVLKDKKHVSSICGDRLPATYDRTQRKVLFIVYQSFLAAVALALSLAFILGGIRLIKLLRSSKKNPNAPLSQDEIKLLLLAIVCGLSFAAHAVFVFVLAIVQPGIAYLVVILVVLECVPSCYLLWNLPTKTRQGSASTAASGGGSASM